MDTVWMAVWPICCAVTGDEGWNLRRQQRPFTQRYLSSGHCGFTSLHVKPHTHTCRDICFSQHTCIHKCHNMAKDKLPSIAAMESPAHTAAPGWGYRGETRALKQPFVELRTLNAVLSKKSGGVKVKGVMSSLWFPHVRNPFNLPQSGLVFWINVRNIKASQYNK